MLNMERSIVVAVTFMLLVAALSVSVSGEAETMNVSQNASISTAEAVVNLTLVEVPQGSGFTGLFSYAPFDFTAFFDSVGSLLLSLFGYS